MHGGVIIGACSEEDEKLGEDVDKDICVGWNSDCTGSGACVTFALSPAYRRCVERHCRASETEHLIGVRPAGDCPLCGPSGDGALSASYADTRHATRVMDGRR